MRWELEAGSAAAGYLPDGARMCHAYTMTLPPQQPATPAAHSSAQTTLSASASSNGAAGGDRFAEGARIGISEKAPDVTPSFDQGFTADPARVFAGPGYNFPPTPVNRPAQFALWFSALAIVFPFALVASVGGGIWGLIHAHLNHGVGRRPAAAALVISTLSALWWLFVWAAVAGLLPDAL